MPASTILLRSLFLFLTLFLCTRKSRVFELNDDDGKKIRIFFSWNSIFFMWCLYLCLCWCVHVCHIAERTSFCTILTGSDHIWAPNLIWNCFFFSCLAMISTKWTLVNCPIACTLANIICLQVSEQAKFGLAFSYRIPFNSNVQLFW